MLKIKECTGIGKWGTEEGRENKGKERLGKKFCSFLHTS